MIKLSDIKERVFVIELPDGTEKKWDIVDLSKLLAPFMDDTEKEGVNSIEELKKIWGLPNLPGSVATGLLAEFMVCYTEEMDAMGDSVKKRLGAKLPQSVASTQSASEKPQDCPQTNA